MNKLSPLTLDRIAGNSRQPIEHHPIGRKQEKRQRAEEVTMWRCPICSDIYSFDDDAEECCQGKKPKDEANDEAKDGEVECPVCGEMCTDHHVAANCCLWKDLTPAARFRIACAVEAGAEWSEAIAAQGETQ